MTYRVKSHLSTPQQEFIYLHSSFILYLVKIHYYIFNYESDATPKLGSQDIRNSGVCSYCALLENVLLIGKNYKESNVSTV